MRTFLATVALALGATSAANAQSFDPAVSAAVSYEDLNLANEFGRAALAGRVKVAANRICNDLTVSPISEAYADTDCRVSMMNSAMRQLELTALRSPAGKFLASR